MSVAAWGEQRARAARHEILKDHRNFFAGTARDYSTTFGAACKDWKHARQAVILLSQAGLTWEAENAAETF
jgi:hypothetical protein